MEGCVKNDIQQRAMRIEKRVVHQGKWLRTCVVDFKNEQGKVLKDWEMVERVRMNPDEICNGVDIVPIVKYKNGTRRLLLIANYRPPVDAYVVEFPAGLLDCDDVIENAHRELKEETGYIADEIKLLNFSPVLRVDPWKSNESSKIVVAFIDGDKECNHNPSQNLETEENIDVFMVDINDHLMENIQKVVDSHGYQLQQKMYAFLLGFQLLSLII